MNQIRCNNKRSSTEKDRTFAANLEIKNRKSEGHTHLRNQRKKIIIKHHQHPRKRRQNQDTRSGSGKSISDEWQIFWDNPHQ
ncbi:hypothetical protein Hdeb2414_s0004g00142741 [Helianthus debilis subsp. tardiflorus]